jgi:pimeloyl-ACP methyl ester carboxylesterase
MALGTRLALRGARWRESQDIAELSRLTPAGSARAFARSVRDVIDWRGQRRNFLHERSRKGSFHPRVVGDADASSPSSRVRAFAAPLTGAQFMTFEGAGHYSQRTTRGLRSGVHAFLDDPTVPRELARPMTEGVRSPREIRAASRRR